MRQRSRGTTASGQWRSTGHRIWLSVCSTCSQPDCLGQHLGGLPRQDLAVVGASRRRSLIALSLSALLGLLPEAKLLETALLEERRMSQPLSSVGLLERRGGVLGSPPVSPEHRDDTPGISPRLLIQHSTREFLSLLTLLVLGSALAAVVQTWLPRSWLLALGSAPTLSVLALMLLALVVSVCSSVDAFLALGLHAQVTPGALLAFLLLGPVVDLKLAGLFTVLLTPRAIAITTASASLMVLLIGQWVNSFSCDVDGPDDTQAALSAFSFASTAGGGALGMGAVVEHPLEAT